MCTVFLSSDGCVDSDLCLVQEDCQAQGKMRKKGEMCILMRQFAQSYISVSDVSICTFKHTQLLKLYIVLL